MNKKIKKIITITLSILTLGITVFNTIPSTSVWAETNTASYTYEDMYSNSLEMFSSIWLFNAWSVYSVADDCTSITRQYQSKNKWSDQQADAFQNALWAAVSSRNVGVNKFSLFSYAYEDSQSNNDIYNQAMDLYNRMVAKNIESELIKSNKDFTINDAAKKVESYVNSGKLYIIKNNSFYKSNGNIRRFEKKSNVTGKPNDYRNIINKDDFYNDIGLIGKLSKDDFNYNVEENKDCYNDCYKYLTVYEGMNLQDAVINLWAIPFKCYDNAELAKKLAESCFQNTNGNKQQYGSGGNGDAFKHTVWNILNCLCFGDYKAGVYGFAHEDSGNNEIEDLGMDIYNNKVGREIAKELIDKHKNSSDKNITLEDVCSAAEKAIRDGRVFRISNKNGVLIYEKATWDDNCYR